MSWINIGLIFVAGLNVGLALLIWLRNPKDKINITFALGVFLIATWTLGAAMFREAQTEQAAWVWTWIQNGAGALIVVPFFLFSLYFPYQNIKLKNWQWLLIGFSVIAMIAVTVIPGAWVKEIELIPHDNTYQLNRLGLVYFNLHFFFYLIFGFYILINKYLTNQGFARRQLAYVISSLAIAGLIGSFFAALMPLIFLKLGPYWVGPYFSLPMILILLRFIYRKD